MADLTMINGNHPYLDSALKRIQECNVIKYAAYRTAAKLRILQRTLSVDQLPLKVISGIFERHQLQSTENSVQLDNEDLESVLSDIFFVVQKEFVFDLDVENAVKLMVNFLFNVFDKKKKGSIQVLSAKIGLVILCQAKPREKYQYLFDQLADHNKCLSKMKLEILLKKTISITEYLNEGLSFGAELIPGTIKSCFKNNSGSIGITEDEFISWLLKDPQLLVWVSTLYRMQIAEMVCHNAKCSVCKIYPIVGLRYLCLQCLSYNQCQTCFFLGKANKKHKLKHPVQEFCCQMTYRQSTKAVLLTLKNKLRKADSKLQYLPAPKTETKGGENLSDTTKLLDEIEVSSKTVVHGSRICLQVNPLRELQSIIMRLDQENKQWLLELENLGDFDLSNNKSRFKECVQEHRAQVETQLQRLKLLKTYLLSQQNPSNKNHLESTPVVLGGAKTKRGSNNELDNISPIARNGEMRKKGPLNSLQKMIWDNYDMGNHDNNTSWEEVVALETRHQLTTNSFPLDDETNSASQNNISTWLGGSVVKDFEQSTNKGFSWINSSNNDEKHESKNCEKLTDEDKQALENLHTDLDDILNKLQKLLNSNSLNQANETSIADNKDIEIAATEVETLLSNLITNVEKDLILFSKITRGESPFPAEDITLIFNSFSKN